MYIILNAFSIDHLMQLVNSYIDDGYMCIGGVKTCVYNYKIEYFQTMIKVEKS